jgi:pheromone shutdown-related protein TraB
MTSAHESNGPVTVLRRDGHEYHVIGTAHVSKKSVEEVRALIHSVKPDTVCVELDETRYAALTDESRWRNLDVVQIVRERRAMFVMASLALQAFQRRIGERLGVRPGAELLAAVEAAHEVGAEVVLADRDVQVTLKRTWANLGVVMKLKLVCMLYAILFHTEELSEAQVEALKDREHIADALSEFAKQAPEVKVPLIDERDRYLMSSLELAPGRVIVGVVGAGHVAGMIEHLGVPVERDELMRMPPPGNLATALRWSVPLCLLGLLWLGQRQGTDLGVLLLAWSAPNTVAASAATLGAGGKLLSVLAATLIAPVAPFPPALGAGMLVGLLEAKLRRPSADHAVELGREVSTFAAMRKNPFSRVLIVSVAAQIGSTLGTVIALVWLLLLVAC